MAYQFNPPPNWPKPPKGWEPTPGWQPDPAWGPAPEGWQFWIDDAAAGSEAQDLSSGGSTAAASHPDTQPTGSGQGTPEPSAQGTETAQPHQTGWQDNRPATDRQARGPIINGQPQQGGPNQGQSHQGSWNNGAPQGNGQQGNGQQPGTKKNFFATTTGILTIIGVVLLALIVALVLTISHILNSASDDDSSAAAATTSQAAPESTPAEESQPTVSPSAAPPKQNDINIKKSGKGKKTISVNSTGNGPYYLEYTWKDSDDYGHFYIDGKFKDGNEDSGVSSFSPGSGSAMLTSYHDDKRLDTITVDATEGVEWTVKLKTKDVPTMNGSKGIEGKTPTAYQYTGGSKVLSVTLHGKDKPSASLRVTDAQGESVDSEFIDGDGQTRSVDLPDTKGGKEPVYVEISPSSDGASWKGQFK